MNRLDSLESESLKLIKSIPQICKNPAQLWSTGKDSMLCLYLARKAFGRIPWPVVHIDTEKKPKEIYEFRNKLALQWQLPLKVIKNQAALDLGISPDNVSRYECCTQLKTNALKMAVAENHWDALIFSIRHDEHYVRGMEDLVSLRDTEGNWQWYGRFGGFGLVAPEQEGYSHIRIHPLLPWTEAEVWEYTMLHQEPPDILPFNPLYFSRNGRRMRSLGCEPCTETLESNAQTLQDIVNEVYMTPGLERSGRQQDKETQETMLILRGKGYC